MFSQPTEKRYEPKYAAKFLGEDHTLSVNGPETSLLAITVGMVTPAMVP